MTEQLHLFDIEDTYNLLDLRNKCTEFIKKKYPAPVDDEDFGDYLLFIKDEADLEFVHRLRVIADTIEKKVLEPQKEMIKDIYRGKI